MRIRSTRSAMHETRATSPNTAHGIGRRTYLIDEVLTMVVAEHLRTYDAMHIGLHEFLHQIDLFELVEGWWAENVEDGNDVLVMKVPEEFDLAQSTETKHGMVKGGDTLDSDFALGREVHRRAEQNP